LPRAKHRQKLESESLQNNDKQRGELEQPLTRATFREREKRFGSQREHLVKKNARQERRERTREVELRNRESKSHRD